MFSVLKRVFFVGLFGSVTIVLSGCVSSKSHPETTTAWNQTNAAPVVAHAAAATNAPGQVSHPAPPADAADNMAQNILVWDSVSKEYRAKAGEEEAHFTFNLANVSSEPIILYDTSTTCDCTVAQLPSSPWRIPPGGSGQIQATLDLHGKTGSVTNYIIVFTNKGNRMLTVTADLPAS